MICYLDTYRRAERQEATLDPDFVAMVLRHPKRGQHAQVNAAFSAQLLEADRRRTRQEEIKHLIEGYTEDVIKLERTMATLRAENRLLEEMNRG